MNATSRQIELPDWTRSPGLVRVISALGEETVRFVGGCVRDSLLGRPVGDIDIATTLTPETVMARLADSDMKTVPTGLSHGTVTVAS